MKSFTVETRRPGVSIVQKGQSRYATIKIIEHMLAYYPEDEILIKQDGGSWISEFPEGPYERPIEEVINTHPSMITNDELERLRVHFGAEEAVT